MSKIMKIVRRTWRERLFSRPFFVATKQVRDHDAERLRDMVQNRPMVSPFEMRSSTTRMRALPRASAASNYNRHSDDTPNSRTDDNLLTGALVGYMVGSHGTQHAAPAESFNSGGGGDFGGAGASASWSGSDSSDTSSSSSSSDSSSSSSSDSGSCSSSD